MIYTDPNVAAPAMLKVLERSERILILTHLNPDGDAIGSLLAMWHALHAMGKTALALASSPLADYMLALPGIEHVAVYERGTPLPVSDLICMVDTAEPYRTGAVYEDHSDLINSHPLIIIDHHVTNAGRGNVNLIDSTSASCAELVYHLLRAMKIAVTPQMATCLLMGVMTDTLSFQTSSTRPQTLHTTAELLEARADHDMVVKEVYQSLPYATIRLVGLALGRLQRDGELIWTTITQEMLRETGADELASDDVVLMMQRVAGARICAMLREREDGQVKVSLRSKPGIDVALIARTWGGGGHIQAAGATLPMNIEAAEQEILPRLRQALG